MFSSKLKSWKKYRIRRGWHEWFAWYPVPLYGETGFAWFRTVERKYYQTHGCTAVKKGLNESQVKPWRSVDVMYRSVGSNAERTCYITKGGTLWRDSKELMREISDRKWDRISRSLDALESQQSFDREKLQAHELEYMRDCGKF